MAEVQHPDQYEWRQADIPGGTVPVTLTRLAIDRETLVSQSLVRFPAGWSRPNPGWYSVDEEFLVVEGELHMSGTVYGPGDYAFVSAGYVRFESATPEECLVLAWFGGRAQWSDSDRPGANFEADRVVQARWSDLPEEAGPVGSGRCLRREPPLSSWVLTSNVLTPAPHQLDLFSIRDYTWTQIAPGEPVPALARPLFARVRTQQEPVE